ncbi:MAG TPA: hypothetical protein DCL38_07265 [Lachnospiraceae bacterium]|nr:hypothetical protein [Lachnospiraceae bacterium]
MQAQTLNTYTYMNFMCMMKAGTRNYQWPGRARLVNRGNPCEAIVEADGWSYHFILGHYDGGYYLCIPDWNIGVDLAYPTDLFWNRDSMIRSGLSKRKTETFVQALLVLSEYLEE